MSKKSLGSILFATALCLCLSGLAIGQEITGTIVGTVKDSSGGVVPGATVKITDPSKGDLVVRTLTTNDSGDFTAPNLAVSTYSISVEATNFKRAVQTGVKLDVGQRRSVDVTLEAGRIEEVVTVEADPVAVELTTPTVSTTISGDQVRELSTNNRNFIQLVTLAPGVSNDLSDQVYVGTTNPEGVAGTPGSANTVNISVNGARSSQNTFTVDGADVTDRGSNITIQAYPSFDSIGEFKVLRSLYPAESGRSGGGQINVVTRSGTDKIHGSLFEFVRNEVFNANNYLVNATPSLANTLGRDDNGKVKRRPFRYNNYGWTIGGPVYFFNFGDHEPSDGFFKRMEKTFFFFSQEFRKDRRALLLGSNVPTANMRAGIFTTNICLRASGTTCVEQLTASAANPVALSTVRPIDPLAQQYINQIYSQLPLPASATSTVLNYPTPNISDFRQEIVKIDHSFNSKASMYYRFQNDTIPTIDANAIFGSGSGIPGVSTVQTNSPGRTHTAQVTYAASSNLIFEGRYTFGYGAIKSNNIGLLSNEVTSIDVPLAYEVTRDRIPSVSGNGVSGLVGFGYYDNFSWKSNVAGSMTWIKGNHAFKFGGMYSQYRKNENALAGNNEGVFDNFFTPGGTQNVNALTGGNTTQQQWANFLMGTNVRFTQASFDYTADLRQKAMEAYVQDEWRFRKNLTLYLGVRYSFFGSPVDKNGRLTNFVPELWDPADAPLVTGAGNRIPDPTKNYCNGMIINSQNTSVSFPNCFPTVSPWGEHIMKVSKTDFAPRVGLAWDPFGKGETAIRTGYGIYHEQVLNGMMLSIIGFNPPFQQTCQVNSTTLNNPVPGGCAVIATNAVPGQIRSIDPNWNTPYMQHWSLDLQQQLSKKTIVSVGYYGSKGTNLIGGYEKNNLPPGYAIDRGATGCAVGSSTTPTAPCQVSGQAFYSTAQEAILDQIRPYRGYRSITTVEPKYDSTYHSLQVSATHRLADTSQIQLAYTWSKNLTNNINDRSTSPQNTYNLGLDYGPAAFDRRHILSVNFIYELPFYRAQNGFAGKLLGGWQLSGIGVYNSGLPFTPTVSAFDPAGLGLIPVPLVAGRPNVTCNPNEGGDRTMEQWFNTSCFQVTPVSGPVSSNTVGNGGRGIVVGPNTRRVDATLSKNFRFGESFRLQLRAEAFNVFNITSFRGFSTAVWNTTTRPVTAGGTCTTGCSTFGQVNSVRDPRTMQFAAKFYF